MWDQERLLTVSEADYPQAETLWTNANAQFVTCSATAIRVDQSGRLPRLDLTKPVTDYRLDNCWLIDSHRAWFACPITDDDSDRLVPLREIWPLLSDLEAQAAVTAVELTAWQAGHGYCSACGATTEVINAGWARRCTACQQIHFPRLDPAIIVALTDQADRLLLGSQPTWGKRHSVFAGYATAGESLEQAIHREVKEEVGLVIRDITYYGSQPWPFPRALMIAYTGIVDEPEALRIDGKEIRPSQLVYQTGADDRR